ncbi:hypothetical protein SFUMM280S_09134 [Streptomyces fumanus]
MAPGRGAADRHRRLPPRRDCSPSAELDTRFGHESGYIEQITGIRTRLKADPDDTFVEMAAQAADKALAHAGLLAGDLDCVVFSSASSVGRASCLNRPSRCPCTARQGPDEHGRRAAPTGGNRGTA